MQEDGKYMGAKTTKMRVRDKMRAKKEEPKDTGSKLKEHLNKAHEHLTAARTLNEGGNPDESQEAHGAEPGSKGSAMGMLGLGQDSEN